MFQKRRNWEKGNMYQKSMHQFKRTSDMLRQQKQNYNNTLHSTV